MFLVFVALLCSTAVFSTNLFPFRLEGNSSVSATSEGGDNGNGDEDGGGDDGSNGGDSYLGVSQ